MYLRVRHHIYLTNSFIPSSTLACINQTVQVLSSLARDPPLNTQAFGETFPVQTMTSMGELLLL